jgi:hypothetical protein
MDTLAPLFFLILFVLSIIWTYVAIRRRWQGVNLISIAGAAASSMSFTLYSMSRGNGVGRAIFTGVFIGLLFTLAAASIAVFYQKQEQRAEQANTKEITG